MLGFDDDDKPGGGSNDGGGLDEDGENKTIDGLVTQPRRPPTEAVGMTSSTAAPGTTSGWEEMPAVGARPRGRPAGKATSTWSAGGQRPKRRRVREVGGPSGGRHAAAESVVTAPGGGVGLGRGAGADEEVCLLNGYACACTRIQFPGLSKYFLSVRICENVIQNGTHTCTANEIIKIRVLELIQIFQYLMCV